ncbi:hypothetical protein Mapa_014812 [Marchantia paleacea]|nr:hypothetical protein Mapa_014812 [Marchantia paleacea]
MEAGVQLMLSGCVAFDVKLVHQLRKECALLSQGCANNVKVHVESTSSTIDQTLLCPLARSSLGQIVNSGHPTETLPIRSQTYDGVKPTYSASRQQRVRPSETRCK